MASEIQPPEPPVPPQPINVPLLDDPKRRTADDQMASTASAGGATPRRVVTMIDSTGDGQADLLFVDTTGDGQPDRPCHCYGVDTTGDGRTASLLNHLPRLKAPSAAWAAWAAWAPIGAWAAPSPQCSPLRRGTALPALSPSLRPQLYRPNALTLPTSGPTRCWPTRPATDRRTLS